ncbi:MAG: hypothetical protein ACYDH5_13000, partial [Acidimicrobiales bacterium]
VRSLCSYGGAISLHLAGPLTEPMAAAQDHLAAALISECFANLASHSNAPAIELSLGWRGDRLQITLHDPGPVLEGKEGPGLGLARLKAMIVEAGGVLEAEGDGRGGGFAVHAELPRGVKC